MMKGIFKLYIFKLIFLSLTMIFISFGASAKLMTTGELYKNCKKYQNDGFQIKNKNDAMEIANAFMCLTRFKTMTEEGDILCMNLKMFYQREGETPYIKVLARRANSFITDINQSIMSFINFAEQNPNKWDRWYQQDRSEYFAKSFPCNYKKKLRNNNETTN